MSPVRRRRSSQRSVYVITANVQPSHDMRFEDDRPRAQASQRTGTGACKTDYSRCDRGDEPSAVKSRSSRHRHEVRARDVSPHAAHRRRYDRQPRDVTLARRHPPDGRFSGDGKLHVRLPKHAVASGCKTNSNGHCRSGHRRHRHRHDRTVPDNRWASDRAEGEFRRCSYGTSSSLQTDNDGLIDFAEKCSRHRQKSRSGHVSLCHNSLCSVLNCCHICCYQKLMSAYDT